jgi:hypothetical protein
VWHVYIDGQTHLPRAVIAKGRDGQLVERYDYRDLIENPAALASTDSFNPEKRWGDMKGLLSRLARAAGGAGAGAADNSQSRVR